MKANVDLSALKRLSKIELFLLLCGITASCRPAPGSNDVPSLPPQ